MPQDLEIEQEVDIQAPAAPALGSVADILEKSAAKAKAERDGNAPATTSDAAPAAAPVNDKPNLDDQPQKPNGAPKKASAPEPKPAEPAPAAPVIPEGYIKADDFTAIKQENESYKARLSKYEQDPILKELIGISDKGGALSHELLQNGYVDYDKYDTTNIVVAHDLLKQKLMESGMSEKEASLELKTTYGALFDKNADEQSEEYELAQLRLTRLAAQYITEKKTNQLKLKEITPASTSEEAVLRKLQDAQLAQFNDKKQQLTNAATQLMKDRKNVDLTFTYKDDNNQSVQSEIKADITEEVRKELTAAISNPLIMDAVAQFIDFSQSAEQVNAAILQRVLILTKPDLYASLIAGEAAAKGGITVLGKVKPAAKPEKLGTTDVIDKSKYDLNTVKGRLDYSAAVAAAQRNKN